MKKRSSKLLLAIFGILGVLLLELGGPDPSFGEKFWNGTVTANVNLREAPGLQGDIVSGLLQGSPVTIYEEKEGWYRVSARKYHQVFNGWVSREYVEIAPEEISATPPVTEAPEPDRPVQSLSPVEPPPQPQPGGAEEPAAAAPRVLPEKQLPQPVEKATPPEEKEPAVSPEPGPDKPAAATPPHTEMAAPQTERPPRVEKTPAADAAAEPADDWQLLLPTALPVVAVIVLLIVVIVYWVKRISRPKAAKPDSAAEPVPVIWPPPAAESPVAENSPVAESRPGIEEHAPAEENLSADFEFQMEAMPEDLTSGDDGESPPEVVPVSDDGNRRPEVVSVYDRVLEKINRLSDVELTELLDLVDDQLGATPRKDDRLTFYTTVDYVVEDQYYRDFIQDLSVSGVFIKARQMFEPGQSILMTFMSPFLQKPFKISGKIVRILDTGIGVKFDLESQVQAEAISALMDQIRSVAAAG